MIISLRYFLLLTLIAFVGWTGWGIYGYFFDPTLPSIVISGVENDNYYAGDIQCGVSSNKTGQLSIWLDGQPLLNSFKLNAKEQDHPFTVPTKTISNGKHVLKVELQDGTWRKNKAIVEKNFIVDNVPLQGVFVRSEADYKVFQGRTLHLQFQVNKEIQEAQISTLSRSFICFPETKDSLIYECFIPISCEEMPNEYVLSAVIKDKVGNTLNLDSKFQVVMYPFKKQTLQVSAEKVAEEKAVSLSGQLLEQELEKLVKNSPRQKLWRGAFCEPIEVARVSCEFGTIRTTKEKGRYMHKGIDVINTPKCVVWAPQDGIVVLKERYEFSGNTVVIDHGMGVLSLFFHLDNFADISVGQRIAKGNPLGTMGMTGYATGYHLHWEMRVANIQVDPMQWTKPNF